MRSSVNLYFNLKKMCIYMLLHLVKMQNYHFQALSFPPKLFTHTWKKNTGTCQHPCLGGDRCFHYTALCVMEAWAATKTVGGNSGLYEGWLVPQGLKGKEEKWFPEYPLCLVELVACVMTRRRQIAAVFRRQKAGCSLFPSSMPVISAAKAYSLWGKA